MFEGRKHPRTFRQFRVRIGAVLDPRLVELTTVENVSFRGARLATQHYWEPGSHVEVKSSSGEFLRPLVPRARARVVYCQVVNGRFAIGLELLSETSEAKAWSTIAAMAKPKA